MAPSDFGLEPRDQITDEQRDQLEQQAAQFAWRQDLGADERAARRTWLKEGRGRKGLRIVIVTGERGSAKSEKAGIAHLRELPAKGRWSDEDASEAAGAPEERGTPVHALGTRVRDGQLRGSSAGRDTRCPAGGVPRPQGKCGDSLRALRD